VKNSSEKYNIFLGEFFYRAINIPTRENLSTTFLSEFSNKESDQKISNVITEGKNGFVKSKDSFFDITQTYLDKTIGSRFDLLSEIKNTFDAISTEKNSLFDNLVNKENIRCLFSINYDTFIERNEKYLNDLETILPFKVTREIKAPEFVENDKIRYFKILGDISNTTDMYITSQDIRKMKTLAFFGEFWDKIREEILERPTIFLGINFNDLDFLDIIDFLLSKIKRLDQPIYLVQSNPIFNESVVKLKDKYGMKIICTDEHQFLKSFNLTPTMEFLKKNIDILVPYNDDSFVAKGKEPVVEKKELKIKNIKRKKRETASKEDEIKKTFEKGNKTSKDILDENENLNLPIENEKIMGASHEIISPEEIKEDTRKTAKIGALEKVASEEMKVEIKEGIEETSIIVEKVIEKEAMITEETSIKEEIVKTIEENQQLVINKEDISKKLLNTVSTQEKVSAESLNVDSSNSIIASKSRNNLSIDVKEVVQVPVKEILTEKNTIFDTIQEEVIVSPVIGETIDKLNEDLSTKEIISERIKEENIRIVETEDILKELLVEDLSHQEDNTPPSKKVEALEKLFEEEALIPKEEKDINEVISIFSENEIKSDFEESTEKIIEIYPRTNAKNDLVILEEDKLVEKLIVEKLITEKENLNDQLIVENQLFGSENKVDFLEENDNIPIEDILTMDDVQDLEKNPDLTFDDLLNRVQEKHQKKNENISETIQGDSLVTNTKKYNILYDHVSMESANQPLIDDTVNIEIELDSRIELLKKSEIIAKDLADKERVFPRDNDKIINIDQFKKESYLEKEHKNSQINEEMKNRIEELNHSQLHILSESIHNIEVGLYSKYQSLDLDYFPIKGNNLIGESIDDYTSIENLGVSDIMIGDTIVNATKLKMYIRKDTNIIEIKTREFSLCFGVYDDGSRLLIRSNDIYKYQIFTGIKNSRLTWVVTALKNFFSGSPVIFNSKGYAGTIEYRNEKEVRKFSILLNSIKDYETIVNLLKLHKEKNISEMENSFYTLFLLSSYLHGNKELGNWTSFTIPNKYDIKVGDYIAFERIHKLKFKGIGFDIKEIITLKDPLANNEIVNDEIVCNYKKVGITIARLEKVQEMLKS